MKNVGKIMIVFVFFWFILAEKINLEVGLIGVCMCALVCNFNKEWIAKNKVGRSIEIKNVRYLTIYLFVLMKEIVVANIQVAKIVLAKNVDISPQVVEFETKLKSDFNKTILANSITLTPGTLTVLMKEDRMIVHCLKKEYIEDVLNSKFEKILLKTEG